MNEHMEKRNSKPLKTSTPPMPPPSPEINIKSKKTDEIIVGNIEFYEFQIKLYTERFKNTIDKKCKKMFREIIKNCEIRIDTLKELKNDHIINDVTKVNNLDFGDFLLKNFIVVAPNFKQGWKYRKDAEIYTTEEAYKLFTSIAR